MISSTMLVCAVVASLGVGVLVAQGICVVMFLLFRTHQRQVAEAKAPEAVQLEVVGN